MHTRKCHFRVIYGPPRCLSQLNGYIFFFFSVWLRVVQSLQTWSVFTEQRAVFAVAHTVSVCLSVCLSDCLSAGRLSVTFVHCIQTADDIVKLLFLAR